MKVLYILSLLGLISCADNNRILSQIEVPREKQVSYGSGSINGFLLKLEKSNEGKCVLYYKKESEKDSQEEKITLEMDAPCEFVRLPNNKIRFYDYGGKNKKYYVVIIVGGKPDSNRKDQLMPEGCGTEFVAISIFEKKIKVADKQNVSGSICPSKGLDEKYFGIYAKP
jgi:hypothetical protein